MPFYNPKARLGQGPKIWNPDWGFASEMSSASFVRPPPQDPHQFKKPAVETMPLSFHTQMFGGEYTNPETGEKFLARLRAPPEPQGVKPHHLGPIEHDATQMVRHNSNYFAKMETGPMSRTNDFGNVPIHVLRNTGAVEDLTNSRALYAGGPPKKKSNFPGLRELPAAYSDDFNGFQQTKIYVDPTPLTGKEIDPGNLAGRIAAPVGGQMIKATPYESIQSSKGKDGDLYSNFAHQVGGLSHTGNPLLDSMRSANERILNEADSQQAMDAVRSSDTAGQFTPGNDEQYSLAGLQKTRQERHSLQRISHARENAPIYSLNRERAHEPTSRVALMRFGHTPIQTLFKQSQQPAGSTRLSAEDPPDYTSFSIVETASAVKGFHPMESLRSEDATQVSGVIHIQNGFTGAAAASETYHAEEQPETYEIESAAQDPAVMSNVPYAAFESHAESVPEVYGDYAPSRDPHTSMRLGVEAKPTEYEPTPMLLKDYAPTRESHTSVRLPYMARPQSTAYKIQTYFPHAAPTPVGNLIRSALPYESASITGRVDRPEFSGRDVMPHGVFQGQLTDPHESEIVSKSVLGKSTNVEMSADNMIRQTVPQTAVNGGIRIDQYIQPEPYFQEIPARTQYLFPPTN